jgi:tRNA (adenine57-N1/adenine58-N1)-methyltransferase
LHIAKENDQILLISPDGKSYMLRLRAGVRFHTNNGLVDHDAIIGNPLGRPVLSHIGHSFIALKPSLYDVLMNLRRVSQIIYPKEIGQILLKLDAGPGRRIVEAGTGSGALTVALAHSVSPDGMVYSYEAREDMLNVARRNIETAGMSPFVRLTQRDISDGFDESDVDALFLDVREPWLYLSQVCDTLTDGGFFGALLPTTNQVSDLLAEMEKHPFMSVEVMEIMERHYKPVAQRLRPEDRMVGHTGFLLFARKIGRVQSEGPAIEWHTPGA